MPKDKTIKYSMNAQFGTYKEKNHVGIDIKFKDIEQRDEFLGRLKEDDLICVIKTDFRDKLDLEVEGK